MKFSQYGLLITALVWSYVAFATGNHDANSHEASSASSSSAANEQSQEQAQEQGNEQSQSVSFKNPDEITVKNTPGVFAPGVFPTAPCMGGASGGIAIPGFGVSGGGNKINADCMKFELARALVNVGEQEPAMLIYCSSKFAEDIREWCIEDGYLPVPIEVTHTPAPRTTKQQSMNGLSK